MNCIICGAPATHWKCVIPGKHVPVCDEHDDLTVQVEQ